MKKQKQIVVKINDFEVTNKEQLVAMRKLWVALSKLALTNKKQVSFTGDRWLMKDISFRPDKYFFDAWVLEYCKKFKINMTTGKKLKSK